MALAARAKLWSTPVEVVDAALDLLGGVGPGSNFVDLGCGSGVSLARAARRGAQATGWEIDAERAAATAAALTSDVECGGRATVVVGNALEADLARTGATHVFLYLVSRGLRAVLPQLREAARARPDLLVVTVQYRVPGLEPTAVVRAHLSKRHEILYLLHLYNAASLLAADEPTTSSSYGDSSISNSGARLSFSSATAKDLAPVPGDHDVARIELICEGTK